MNDMRKRYLILVAIATLVLSLAACSDLEEQEELQNELSETKESLSDCLKENEELMAMIEEMSEEEEVKEQGKLLVEALNVINILKDNDLETLSRHVDSQKGLRFSPYSYVNLENDMVFNPGQIAWALKDSNLYVWGTYDGIGGPIEKTFMEYYDDFVYDVDFANPHLIGNNMNIGSGNTINNISEAYPDASFVEFYFKGFEQQYQGMDWKSLSLVFEQTNDVWKLVGIVHGQWTI